MTGNRLAVLAIPLAVQIGFGVPGTLSARGDERLFGIACRSVHLAYETPESLAFYNEIAVDESAPGTYFCVAGFGGGYYGIQELANGKKLLIFSVWDPGNQNDPERVDQSQRVQLVAKNEKVRVGRFGNEGTGGQSFLDYDWKVGETYRFLISARRKGDRTEYSSHFFSPEARKWEHLVTFSTLNQGKLLQGPYAFVEDFKRDRLSTKNLRKAFYGPAYLLTAEGRWQAAAHARFTADGNPDTHIDAGMEGNRFYLATGGETSNTGTRLRERLNEPSLPELPPADVREFVVSLGLEAGK